MEKIRITIHGENRDILIPMEYNKESDTLNIHEVQIDPYPEKDEGIDKDIVLQILIMILDTLQNDN